MELQAQVSLGFWVLFLFKQFSPSKSGQVNPDTAADANCHTVTTLPGKGSVQVLTLVIHDRVNYALC